MSEEGREPIRRDGYAPIRDYAAIGDGTAVALVALDGSIDWLCLPQHDSEPVFAALLDPEGGGSCSLRPDEPFRAARRYLPESNVLETTFTTSSGSVRVTDALTLQAGATLPWRELVRRVEGLSGSVPMRWSVGASEHLERGVWTRGAYTDGGELRVLRAGDEQLAVLAWDAGEPVAVDEGGAGGRFEATAGGVAQLALVSVTVGPVPCPSRDEVAERLDATTAAWRRWIGSHTYEGPWREAVVRSLLALKLLICTDTGAIVAAPTTSLPERIGGGRNWDYRYAWTRDSCWTMSALIRLGFREQAHESLAWLLDAVRGTHPDVDPIYRLDGSVLRGCEELDRPGYLGSQPVRVGNSAGEQLQLGGYGDLLDTAWAYVLEGNAIDPDTGRRLAELVDHVCGLWREADSGIWELDETRHYTQSKIACWTALRRALDLAEAGQVPGQSAGRWRRTIREIESYVEESCWSEERGSYVQSAGASAVDAAELLCVRRGYGDVNPDRLAATVETIRRELARGPLLYRYSGQETEEGAFVACSFWLVEALARLDRLDEATELMEETLAFSNDVGLFSEEIEPSNGDFLGNFPQGLSHLALVMAADLVEEARERHG